MDSTITMWLGIAFLVLGIVAVVMQAWLWSFPMVPDPGGPDPNGKSTAPKHWTQFHRIVGLAYVIIYIIMMREMIPRLWEYQTELPARTIIHAVMGISIGFILVIKIAIIRWFQHFGKALPALGTWLLYCTVMLSVLSIPYAMRAHGIGMASLASGVEKIRSDMPNVDFDEEIMEWANSLPEIGNADSAEEKKKKLVDHLATKPALTKGRRVLMTKCTSCHDLRTAIARPRPASAWHSLVVRMARKPTIHAPINGEDMATVTAYLVAITPDLKNAAKKRKKTAAPTTPSDTATAALTAEELAGMKETYDEVCTECHEGEKAFEWGAELKPEERTIEAWTQLTNSMTEEMGAEYSETQAQAVIRYLHNVCGDATPNGACAP